MELQQIMDELRVLTPGQFPEEAVRAAVAHREEITPLLLAELERLVEVPELLDEDGYTLPMFALYLLAQFRDPRAWPVVLRLFGKPGETGRDVSDCTGDFVTEDLPRVLACVYNGDLAPLVRVIMDPECDEWVRGAGIRAVVCLVVNGRLSLAEAETLFGRLLRGGLPDEIAEDEEGDPWNSLAGACANLRLASLKPELLQACETELVNPEYITITGINREMALPLNLAELRNEYMPAIDDAAAEMREWPCFNNPDWGKHAADAPEEFDEEFEPGEYDETEEVLEPIQREQPKVSRNAPCPCGSGKKYKKCCGG